MRGIAALLVVLTHVWAASGAPALAVGGVDLSPIAAGGWMGVDLFFVLSGFLLAHSGGRAVEFWRRRCARVLPAYWTQLAVLFAAGWWASGQAPASVAELFAQVTLTFNIFDTATLNPVYWSLPVEVDFYLLLPLIAVFVRRRPVAWWLGLLAVAVAFRWSCVLAVDRFGLDGIPYARWIIQLPARIDQFAAGLCAAYLLRHMRAHWLAPIAMLAGSAMVLAVMWDAAPRGNVIGQLQTPQVYGYYSVLGVAFALIVAGAARGPGRLLGALLGNRALVVVGQISFSLYLWHLPVLNWLREHSEASLSTAMWLQTPLVALAIAWLSWRFIERPFHRGAAPPAATTSLRVAAATGAQEQSDAITRHD